MSVRVTVRNILNNQWLDQCNSEFYFRDAFNASWVRFYPAQTKVRDSGNSKWLDVDCTFDPALDDPCANLAQLNSIACPDTVSITDAGSGNGLGSGGAEFDILEGYPAGYDLPDAGQVGFGLEKSFGTYEGLVINRPGIDNLKDTYDNSGINSFYGRGTYENPSFVSTHTFSTGSAVTETIYETGDTAGQFEILYASYAETGISIDVYYLGALIASTCGRVFGRGKLEFGANPNIGAGESRVMIRVRGEDKTRWQYSVVGPKAVLALPVFEPGNNRHLAQIRNMEYVGTSIFPAPAHSRVAYMSDRFKEGQWWQEYVHTVGLVNPAAGPYVLHLNYETWENADWVEVYHGGERIASTMGNKNTDGLLRIVFDPWRFATPVPDIVVKVMAQEREYLADMSSQEYMLYDPNTAGYKENRFPCEMPEAGISSAGHYSTEDHYRMNTLDGDGVASIKITGYGDFTYTASVFDKNGELVTAKKSRGTSFLQWFRLKESSNFDDLEDVSVRIDSPLDSSWTYWVGCYVPLLNVEIDDQLVPLCPDVQIAINSIRVNEGSTAKFTVALNYPTDQDISVDYTTQDITALSTAGDVAGSTNPYPLFRQDGIVSSVVYDDENQNYTLVLEADPSRLYDLDDFDYMQGYYNSSNYNSGNTDHSVSNRSELPPYFQMLANIFENRLGTLSSSTKMLIVSHQRILEYATPYDPDPRVDEREYEVAYHATKGMDHLVSSMNKIFGIQVDVHFVNNFGDHGETRDNGFTTGSSTYSTPKDIVDRYDIVIIDQWGEWRQHAAENSDISSATDFSTKVFSKEQATAWAIAVSRAAQKSNEPVVVVQTAALDTKTYSSPYKYMNANAKDLINAFGLKAVVNIVNETSNVSGLSNIDSISVQAIIDKAGDSYLFAGMNTANSRLPVQSNAARMTNLVVKTVSDGNVGIPTTEADYQAKSGTLIIPAGAGSGTISVNTYSDSIKDPNEQFKVIISNPSAGEILDSEGIATIVESSAPTSGDMNIVYTSAITSIGTAKVTATKYAHPETILAFRINASKLEMTWPTDGDLGEGTPAYTENPGDVSVFTMRKTADSATDGVDDKAAGVAHSSNLLAQFEFDPNRTYTYKWNVTVVNNTIPGSRISTKNFCAFDVNNEPDPRSSSYNVYSPDNLNLSIQFEREVSNSSLAGTASLEVEIFVKDDLGGVQKSAPIPVSIQQKAQVYSGGGGGGCVSFGTLVHLEDGSTINAERLRVGDRVVSTWFPGMIDENTPGWQEWTTTSTEGNRQVISTVTSIKHDWFREYWVINGDVEITQEHEIFVKRKDTWHWMDVRDIQIGDYLWNMQGREVYVGTLERVKDPIDVVIIDIEENDSYYVGKNPILIHNTDSFYRKN